MNKDNKRDLILERSLTGAIEKTINQFDKMALIIFQTKLQVLIDQRLELEKSLIKVGLTN